MGRRARIAIPLLLLLALAVWGVSRYLRAAAPRNGEIAASGTIEALQVSVASKVPGRIERIGAEEGTEVTRGAPLVTIEGRELIAQLDQVTAAIDVARARVAQANAALALQIRQVEAQVAQAQAGVDAARTRVSQAQEAETLTSAQGALAVTQAEAALAVARDNSASAKATLDRTSRDLTRIEALYRDGAVSGQALDAARAAFNTAEAQHAASRSAVAQAGAALRLARENLGQVRLRERDVSTARAQARQADAALRLARAGEELIAQRRADVAAAEAAVRQAEAALRVLRTQHANLVVTAPMDGIVLAKHASEGEIVGGGAPILTLADLSDVWLRLYIPLPQLGSVTLGQRAQVTTDAVPDRTFEGTITEISQQAEFTPRNVQTREERVKLVFAVKITIPNPQGVLKPGMPADAVLVPR